MNIQNLSREVMEHQEDNNISVYLLAIISVIIIHNIHYFIRADIVYALIIVCEILVTICIHFVGLS